MSTDTSGWCHRVPMLHKDCDGVLHAATGYHWWCACSCHPDDMVKEPAPDTADYRAWEVWRAARPDVRSTA